MSRGVRHAVIGFAVVFVLSFALAAVGFGGTEGTIASMGVGLLTYYALQARSGTDKEVFVPKEERDTFLQVSPAADEALLFIRRTGIRGSVVGINLALDGTPLAQLRSPRSAGVRLHPGTHTLAASNSGGGPMNTNTDATVSFEALGGQRVLFDLSLNMGMMKSSYVLTRVLDESAFMASLGSIQMVRANESSQAVAPAASA